MIDLTGALFVLENEEEVKKVSDISHCLGQYQICRDTATNSALLYAASDAVFLDEHKLNQSESRLDLVRTEQLSESVDCSEPAVPTSHVA